VNALAGALAKLGLIRPELDVHLVRASLVLIFFFGYQKWFEYEAQYLIPYRGVATMPSGSQDLIGP
jgi:uncharacterized membrane protein YkgB